MDMELGVVRSIIIAIIVILIFIVMFGTNFWRYGDKLKTPAEYTVRALHPGNGIVDQPSWGIRNDRSGISCCNGNECSTSDCNYVFKSNIYFKSGEGRYAISGSFMGNNRLFGCIINGNLQWPCEITQNGASIALDMSFFTGPPTINASHLATYSSKVLLNGQRLILGNFTIEIKVRNWIEYSIFGMNNVEFTVRCKDGDSRIIKLNFGKSMSTDLCDGSISIRANSVVHNNNGVCVDINVNGGTSDGNPWGGIPDTMEIMFWNFNDVWSSKRCGDFREFDFDKKFVNFNLQKALTDSDCVKNFAGIYKINVPVPRWEDFTAFPSADRPPDMFQPETCYV